MTCRPSYILRAVAVVAVCLVAASCSHKADPIPRGKLAKIYAEMFMLDQQLENQSNLRVIADTTIVYEAILQKYGYTWENYLASQEKYIKDPERYSRIIKKAVAILSAEQKTLEKEKKRIDDILFAAQRMKLYAPNRIYLLDTASFSFDFDFQLGLDTVYAGPRLIVASDTLAACDSAAVKKDSLEICSASVK